MGRRQPTTHALNDQDFSECVRQIVAMLLAGGFPEVRLVANMLRTTSRTLQRRLHGVGLTYAGVVQRARCAAAQEMLRHPDRTIADVARTLGYSDPAHFTRAFRRWTGDTPRAFRRRGRGAKAAVIAPTSRRVSPRG